MLGTFREHSYSILLQRRPALKRLVSRQNSFAKSATVIAI